MSDIFDFFVENFGKILLVIIGLFVILTIMEIYKIKLTPRVFEVVKQDTHTFTL
jgi:hypothetical protein